MFSIIEKDAQCQPNIVCINNTKVVFSISTSRLQQMNIIMIRVYIVHTVIKDAFLLKLL